MSMPDEASRIPRGAASHDALFSSLELDLSVRLIATLERDVVTCDESDVLSDVLLRADLKTFDYVPVRKHGRIVGILPRKELSQRNARKTKSGKPNLLVRDAMKPLNEDNLISADAGILTFLETADDRHCRLVIDGRRISGIVTISDLQKLPVRPVIFLFITHLELLMTDYLRSKFGNSDDWVELLHPNRKDALKWRYKRLRKSDNEVDLLTATTFREKREVVLNSRTWPVPPKKANREFDRIERLRNDISHARNYASTPPRARQTVETVKLARNWIDLIRDAIEEHEKGEGRRGTGNRISGKSPHNQGHDKVSARRIAGARPGSSPPAAPSHGQERSRECLISKR